MHTAHPICEPLLPPNVPCIIPPSDPELGPLLYAPPCARAPLQPEFPSTSGLEHHGDTWPAMLKGLKTDAELGIVPAASSA